MRVSNDLEALQAVTLHAKSSLDPSTQNSAALYDDGYSAWIYDLTLSVNGFPDRVKMTDERCERPIKYSYFEHAERNAVYRAARFGIPTTNLVLVCPWAACADCARAIIQAGIVRLVTLAPASEATNERWDDSIRVAMEMLEESGVMITSIPGPIMPTDFTIRRNGTSFRP
jgi:deoxycytidylate deaminase